MAKWYLDMTKTGGSKTSSGLTRVTLSLFAESRRDISKLTPVRWSKRRFCFVEVGPPGSPRIKGGRNDVFITAEVFCETERPGFRNWRNNWPGKIFAIFHDLIPLQFPEFTWPQSVQRHPHYLKELLLYDGVFAVSKRVQEELKSFWQLYSNRYDLPTVSTIPLGANRDKNNRPSTKQAPREDPYQLLSLGIIEPRKDPLSTLKAVYQLNQEGIDVEWNIVGRVNPHFGRPLLKSIMEASKKLKIHYHEQLSDSKLDLLWKKSTALVFPSKVEGFGLPVLESLWEGVAVVCTDVPATEDPRIGQAVHIVPEEDPQSIVDALKAIFQKAESGDPLVDQELRTSLPTWEDSWLNLKRQIETFQPQSKSS